MQEQQHDREFLDFLTLPKWDFVRNFGRATGWGALAGVLPALFLLAVTGIGGIARANGVGDVAAFVGFALLIFFWALAISLMGTAILMVFFQLPLTAVLRWLDIENPAIYVTVSLLAGLAIPAAVIWINDGAGFSTLFFTLHGGLAGTVAGIVWARWRHSLGDNTSEPDVLGDAYPAPPPS